MEANRKSEESEEEEACPIERQNAIQYCESESWMKQHNVFKDSDGV